MSETAWATHEVQVTGGTAFKAGAAFALGEVAVFVGVGLLLALALGVGVAVLEEGSWS